MSPIEQLLQDAAREAAKEAVAEALQRHVLPPAKRYLTMEEAAAYCGLDYFNFCKDVNRQDGSGPAPIRMKKRIVRFDLEELDRFMLSHQEAAQPEGVVG